MKPDWKDAPDWANWLSLSMHGQWVWSEAKPYFLGHFWHVVGGRAELAAQDINPLDSLEQRP